ncbi:putative lipoprotein (plasmid) [Cupriavidus necator H850]|uniref:toxin co-regulated pilus biosynthesis Q family protein n=1 Tax=Cupriavidus necator TaxID=106590 RepID=UPI00129E7151|nr:toxin co-regulated pilus biosynthesis Q family protein [Cupriavidus necator]KAI3602981.1 putative lipoprotein [Cupriavidus necator H850]
MLQQTNAAHGFRPFIAAVFAVFCFGAYAAVPPSTPFVVEPVGNFEPSKPLAGAGWQVLAANRRPAKSSSDNTVPGVTATTVQSVPEPAATAAPVATNSPQTWTVSPADGNFRQLIETWTSRAGWTAAPWELEKDVPIVGGDVFSADFKAAVRRVLSSTEMTDYAIKPCFYSNNVVRVVKQTTKCDPSKQ